MYLNKFKNVMTGTFKGEADVLLESEAEPIAQATCDLAISQKWPDAEGFGTGTDLVEDGLTHIRGSIKVTSGEPDLINKMITEGKAFLFLKLSNGDIYSIDVKQKGLEYNVSSDF